MTLPFERYRAVTATEQFLSDLMRPERTPRVPKDVRDRARMLLRHYPAKSDMSLVCQMRHEFIENPFKESW